ncbi:hypothetical protein NQZ68_024825 [Dissostichus eleginoides]|nr:hypothetical protein NQZ68_024825 [Dissostichus eleginoides]
MLCSCFSSCVKRSGVACLLRAPSSESSEILPAAVVKQRRDLLQAKLNSHRSDRLKRELPADNAVQEDIQIKKRMLELMEQTSSRNADNMQQINASITSTIQDGFSLMKELINAHPHSSSGGYGQFQEHSPPFMHRSPHPATLAFTPTPSSVFCIVRQLFKV